MPARHSQDKIKATATPLTAIAPPMPARPASMRDTEGMLEGDSPAPDAFMLAETETGPETMDDVETVPEDTATAPPRRGGRKITPRRSAAGIPRTIAELQRQEAGLPLDNEAAGLTTAANIAAPSEAEDAEAREEEEPPVLLVPPRTVAIMTAIMWVLAAFAPQVVLVACERAGLGITTASTSFYIALGVGGVAALVILLWAWRRAFGPHLDDLSWRTLPDIWYRRTKTYPGGLARRDGWTTAALATLGGFIFLAGLLLFTVLRGLPATLPILPVLLLIVPVKALVGAVFVGFLQRALTAVYPRSRAALITGVAYGLAIAAQNAVAFAAPSRPAEGQVISSVQVLAATAIAVAISFFVGMGIAWFRLRACSVWAAIAFQLTLLLLQFPV